MTTSHDPSATVRRSREVERQVTGPATSDGAGVRLTRVLTQDLQRRLEGAVEVGERGVPVADGVVLAAAAQSRVLFVMNTGAEIRQAIEDAAAGRVGAIPAHNLAASESEEIA